MAEHGTISINWPASDVHTIIVSALLNVTVLPRDDDDDVITLKAPRSHPGEEWKWVKLRGKKLTVISLITKEFERPIEQTGCAVTIYLPRLRVNDIVIKAQNHRQQQ